MKDKIAIVLGSKSDLEKVDKGLKLLEEFNIPYILEVISAHRHPDKLRMFCKKASQQGIRVIIGCAGMSAALPGFIAAYTNIPVIGVPLPGGLLDGMDALLSIVQTPKGIGLVSTGVGNLGLINAIIFAVKILALYNNNFNDTLLRLNKKFKK